MAESIPFPSVLSQLLVAFTIEFDNEFENRMEHWTTRAGRDAGPRGAPWLASQVMWANVMQYIDGEGISVADLHARSRTMSDALTGLERWGYVTVTPAPGSADGAGRPRRDDLIVRPTRSGRAAQAVWRPLAAEVEARWRLRFGSDALEHLRRSLAAVRDQFEVELPRYLPIVYPTQNGKAEARLSQPLHRPEPRSGCPAGGEAAPAPDLSVLMAQVLLHFALDYEREARVSLTIAANTLRVLDAAGVRVRDLPRLTGVSKEANAMALGFLSRQECMVLEPDPSASRGTRARLTPKGERSQDTYLRLLAETEENWKGRFGAANVNSLRESLLRVAGGRIPLRDSVLCEGLRPHPGGWRASVSPPETLPHYPMVLHRGGYPDGS